MKINSNQENPPAILPQDKPQIAKWYLDFFRTNYYIQLYLRNFKTAAKHLKLVLEKRRSKQILTFCSSDYLKLHSE